MNDNWRTADRIVLDIGSLYVKVGIAGEHNPRYIIRNGTFERAFTSAQKSGSIRAPFQCDPNCRIFERTHLASIHPENLYCGYMTMCKGALVCTEISVSKSQLFSFLKNIYHSLLLADPEKHPVTVLENAFISNSIRVMIYDILLNDFRVPSCSFLPSSVGATAAAGLFGSCALIVDVGFSETTVVPVVEGCPLYHYAKYVTCAGLTLNLFIHDQIIHMIENSKAFLLKDGQSMIANEASNFASNLLSQVIIIENLKAQIFSIESPQELDMFAIPVTSNIHVKIPQDFVFSVLSKLFGGDDEEQSVLTCILDSLLKCPLDFRKLLCDHMVLSGGSCMSRHFRVGLLTSMSCILKRVERYSTLLPLFYDTAGNFTFRLRDWTPFPSISLSWTGGSLVASARMPVTAKSNNLMNTRTSILSTEIDRDTYIIDKNLSLALDWSSPPLWLQPKR